MSVYTKSLGDHSANLNHKFNLNCHEVFNIIKVELRLMIYQCNPLPMLLDKSQFSASHSCYLVHVCAKIFIQPC